MSPISWKFLTLLLTYLTLAEANRYQGYKIFDITIQSKDNFSVLRKLSTDNEELYNFFSLTSSPGHSSRLMVHPEEKNNLINLLDQNEIAYQIIDENFGATLERDVQIQKFLRRMKPYVAGRGLGTDRFHTHNEINSYLEDLAARYPQRVYVKTYGKSFEGRLMKTIRITNGDGRENKNVVLIDGGFHANEWSGPAVAVYIIEQLVENFEENSDLLQDYDWIVLPVVNPDGYEYTQISADTRVWRKTRQPHINGTKICYGTDPNRNFDFHWSGEGSSSEPCSNVYAGPKPFSEPETIVVRDLINSFKDRGIMYLTLHSYGSLILYPWGWIEEVPDTWEDLQEVGDAARDRIFQETGRSYEVGCSAIVLYTAAGASDDYAFQAGFPISYTMELPRNGPTGHDPPPTAIDGLVKETWVGIRAMGKKIIEKYPLKKKR